MLGELLCRKAYSLSCVLSSVVLTLSSLITVWIHDLNTFKPRYYTKRSDKISVSSDSSNTTNTTKGKSWTMRVGFSCEGEKIIVWISAGMCVEPLLTLHTTSMICMRLRPKLTVSTCVSSDTGLSSELYPVIRSWYSLRWFAPWWETTAERETWTVKKYPFV